MKRLATLLVVLAVGLPLLAEDEPPLFQFQILQRRGDPYLRLLQLREPHQDELAPWYRATSVDGIEWDVNKATRHYPKTNLTSYPIVFFGDEHITPALQKQAEFFTLVRSTD